MAKDQLSDLNFTAGARVRGLPAPSSIDQPLRLGDVGTTAGTVAAGNDARLVTAAAAALILGTETIGTDSFSVNFATQAIKTLNAIGNVSITGATGMVAGARVELVLRNTTAADIGVVVTPAFKWTGSVPVKLIAGGEGRIWLTSKGTTAADVSATWLAPDPGLGPLDNWTETVCAGSTAGGGTQSTTFSQPFGGGVAVNFAFTDPLGWGWWSARAAAASSNSGYGWVGSGRPARRDLAFATRAAVHTVDANNTAEIAGLFSAGSLNGYGFFCAGNIVRARVAQANIISSGTLFTMTVGKMYVFETRVNSTHTAVRFVIRDGDSGAPLLDETIATNMPTEGLALGPMYLRAIAQVALAAQTLLFSTSDFGFGTVTGLDNHRRNGSPSYIEPLATNPGLIGNEKISNKDILNGYAGLDANARLVAARMPALTGAVTTVAGATVTTISIDAVTNAQLANMAAATFKGAVSAGDPVDLTAAQSTSILDPFSPTLKGLVPASGGGLVNYLRADGAFAVPPGAGPTMTAVTIVVPFETQEQTVVVANAAITLASRIAVMWGSTVPSDENEPTSSNVTFSAAPAAGSVSITVSANDNEMVGGSYKILYITG